MSNKQSSGNYVRMMTCKFCGGKTNAIAVSNRIRNGDLVDLPEIVPDQEPCDDCKKRFADGFLYFIGNCEHSGFIRKEAVKRILTEEGMKALGNNKIFRIEKCFMCLGLVPKEAKQYIGG